MSAKRKWTKNEMEFDRIMSLLESPRQMDRIKGRIAWDKFVPRFTVEQLAAMAEVIGAKKRKYSMKNYDEKCADLARHFLGEEPEPESVAALALHIQEAVEDWMIFQSGADHQAEPTATDAEAKS